MFCHLVLCNKLHPALNAHRKAENIRYQCFPVLLSSPCAYSILFAALKCNSINSAFCAAVQQHVFSPRHTNSTPPKTTKNDFYLWPSSTLLLTEVDAWHQFICTFPEGDPLLWVVAGKGGKWHNRSNTVASCGRTWSVGSACPRVAQQRPGEDLDELGAVAQRCGPSRVPNPAPCLAHFSRFCTLTCLSAWVSSGWAICAPHGFVPGVGNPQCP